MKKLFSCLLLIVWGIIFSSGVQALPVDSLEVTTIDAQAGAASLYTLNFTLSETLPSDALIEVTFPEGYDLSGVALAGSSTINGGFDVTVDQQTVFIKRKGLGSIKNPGDKVDVKFSVVSNPSEPKSASVIKAVIKDSKTQKIITELNGRLTISEKKSVDRR